MNIRFYGTRGSIPVCSKDFLEFGGNTSCIAIEVPGLDVINIIDAGSGIRILGKELMKRPGGPPKSITIGFSHFHWDHIQGFPFFVPAYIPGARINLLMMGKDSRPEKLKKIMFDQMGGAFFPINVSEMGADFNYVSFAHKVTQQSTGITVTAELHNHPGDAYSFRLERNGKSLVIVTDIEHENGISPETVALARNADLLIHDAQYTSEELKTKKGWGHSSYKQAIEVARLSGAKHLVMTHHDPDHNDVFLADIEKKCQAEFPNCRLAREGMEIGI